MSHTSCPIVVSITLRFDPDAPRRGYRISAFAIATVGGWTTPVAVRAGAELVDADKPLPEIGLWVAASEIQAFVDRANIEAIQRATKAARQRLRGRRRP
jgi:hypothetical protein